MANKLYLQDLVHPLVLVLVLEYTHCPSVNAAYKWDLALDQCKEEKRGNKRTRNIKQAQDIGHDFGHMEQKVIYFIQTLLVLSRAEVVPS